MKILVDAHIFDHSFQGTASYIRGLYIELVKYEDVEITLCGNNIEALKKNFVDPRFKFIELKNASRLRRLAFEIPGIIRKYKFDYAHFQYLTPFVKGCRYINTIHDLLFIDFKEYFPWTYRISRKILFHLSAVRSDILLTVSQHSKVEIHTKFNIPLNKINVTPNAVNVYDGEYIDVKNKYKLRNYILYVSRFEPRKNHLALLKAYLELHLHNKGYDLVFIGSKNEQIEYDAYQLLLTHIPNSIRKHVFFFEHISWNELHSFYHAAECFVFPSLAEGFGIPPIEAAVNNTKVVCSNQTAMSDFHFFPYLFNPKENLLPQILTKALDDTQYPYQKIKETILKTYSWKTIADNFYTLLKDDYVRPSR